ncbi:secreted RxLR effector protein 161-like [Rutidosis leptorrhynchoides]|uniref:secreted RxLR effector protein 161-like n=1 Tax=Rutidosis leptorrhynchoides TaxID=125765 RepID=UPI003A99DEEA
MENGYRRGVIDQNLFIKEKGDDIMLAPVYVDDIIFRSTDQKMVDEFQDIMQKRFKMSSLGAIIGSLMYLTASCPNIMFATCLCAHHQAQPNVNHMLPAKKIMRYLKGNPSLGLWYLRKDGFELIAYSDSDYGGCKRDFKSTSCGCQFLGSRLVSWQRKKQTAVTQSTCEAEYIVAASCTSQVVWIQQQLRDYG